MFTRRHLKKWWNKALRRRVLYSALDHYDRSYMYVAMRAFDEIRDAKVGTIIIKILAKLSDALKSPFVKKMETYGIRKAWIMSKIAVEWGHRTAGEWADNVGFVRYLTALEFNSPSGWGV